MIIYKWTGEYRPPEKAEWFMEYRADKDLMEPMCFTVVPSLKTMRPRFILDRQEIPDPAPEGDDGK